LTGSRDARKLCGHLVSGVGEDPLFLINNCPIHVDFDILEVFYNQHAEGDFRGFLMKI
jgi:hypothetical protein